MGPLVYAIESLHETVNVIKERKKQQQQHNKVLPCHSGYQSSSNVFCTGVCAFVRVCVRVCVCVCVCRLRRGHRVRVGRPRHRVLPVPGAPPVHLHGQRHRLHRRLLPPGGLHDQRAHTGWDDVSHTHTHTHTHTRTHARTHTHVHSIHTHTHSIHTVQTQNAERTNVKQMYGRWLWPSMESALRVYLFSYHLLLSSIDIEQTLLSKATNRVNSFRCLPFMSRLRG